MLHRLLSYFIPVNIHKQRSAISKTLEVTWNNGQLVLDSRNTNYSYGSLQRVLRRGLLAIGFDRIRKMEHILILGVAAGSVIKTLVDEVRYNNRITGVELDADVIEIGKRYFGLAEIPNLELVTADAFEYTLRTKNLYDLIVIDIFQDTEMPNFLFETFFFDRLGTITAKGSVILFNTMTLSETHNIRNSDFRNSLNPEIFKITSMPRLESHNELMILERV